MAEYFNNDLDYILEDHSDTGYSDYFDDDDFDWDDQQGDGHGSRLEIANGTTKQNSDTSASEYRNGKDMQGIPWERLNHSRSYYREMRLKMYKNYESLLGPHGELEQECKQVDDASTFYDFYYNTRLVKSTIVHFQLRNLIWATSKHDVYLVHDYSIMHWSSLQRTGKEMLNVAGKVIPTEISAMCGRGKLLVAGGFHGELICKVLDQPGVVFSTKLNDDGDITNAVDVVQASSGSPRVVTACNDSNVRVFDAETFVRVGRLSCSWSVNSTSTSPDGRLLAIVGDNKDGLLVDSQSGKVVSNLRGHFDYSFASAWHPDGCIIATGSQDKTCRLWDVRNTSRSLAVLRGRIGAIRGVKFSSDGRFMAVAEAADFVRVYDARAEFGSAQEIDVFGEIAGVAFSPDSDAVFVGVADRTYGSLLEFRRRKQTSYLDCFL